MPSMTGKPKPSAVLGYNSARAPERTRHSFRELKYPSRRSSVGRRHREGRARPAARDPRRPARAHSRQAEAGAMPRAPPSAASGDRSGEGDQIGNARGRFRSGPAVWRRHAPGDRVKWRMLGDRARNEAAVAWLGTATRVAARTARGTFSARYRWPILCRQLRPGEAGLHEDDVVDREHRRHRTRPDPPRLPGKWTTSSPAGRDQRQLSGVAGWVGPAEGPNSKTPRGANRASPNQTTSTESLSAEAKPRSAVEMPRPRPASRASRPTRMGSKFSSTGHATRRRYAAMGAEGGSEPASLPAL